MTWIPVIAAAALWAGSASASIASEWASLSGNREGKVVYGANPNMYVLDLTTSQSTRVSGVTVAGSSGSTNRGKSPRPSWSPDGDRFLYRYNGHIYVCDPAGNRSEISNSQMKRSDETRWSWWKGDGGDWAVGPSTGSTVIRVKISSPSTVKTVYSGNTIGNWCEMTGTGQYVVYDSGDIYVAAVGSGSNGYNLSSGQQSCRPCAAPDNRVAWLQSPHTRYRIHNATNGSFLYYLNAPSGEELYRMNWSNKTDYAAHMYGSSGNERMHVRKISSQGKVYVGNGWDPDLWVGPVVSADPKLSLSPTSLSFSATEGGSDPSPKTVSVTNSGDGTLNPVSTQISYGSGSGWLSVAHSGSGNSQTLTNSVDISAVSPGSYTATVSVSSTGATNSPRSYSVSLTVNAVTPSISLSPTSLSFGAMAGGSDPSPKTVSVSNGGNGTLGTVSTQVNYGSGSGWLPVSRTGSGNSQTLTNSVDIGGLAAGDYTATVQVSCGNAVNSPQSYSVQLSLGQAPSLSAIQVSPSSASISPSGTADFTAQAKDQYGDPIATVISWSVSGGGSMSPATSGSAVTQHVSTFSSDATEGTFTVTASSAGVQGTATVSVSTAPVTVDFSPEADTYADQNNPSATNGSMSDMRVGGGSATRAAYVRFVVSGVSGAVTEAKLVLCCMNSSVESGGDIHLISDNSWDEATLSWNNRPSVDGAVLDTLGPVTYDQTYEFNVTSAVTGDGTYSFALDTTAPDGCGYYTKDHGVATERPILRVTYSSGTGPVNQAPAVDAGTGQTITLPTDTVNLNGTVTDDGLPDPPGSVTTNWTKVSGVGSVAFGDASLIDTTATFSEDGTYVLRLTADDGQKQAADDVTITVNAANQAPTVNAGQDQTITLPTDAVDLNGTVADDGLPDPPGAVTTTWAKTSGPGTVAFGNASAVDTTATFSDAGTYVLRLRADDGEKQASDDVTITVNPEPSDDVDGDGLPDLWEEQHFGNAASCDPGDDPDNDNFTNAQEYNAGTDPHNPDTDGDGIMDGEDPDPLHDPKSESTGMGCLPGFGAGRKLPGGPVGAGAVALAALLFVAMRRETGRSP